MKKPVVGQTLFSLNVGNAARNTKRVLTPVTVTKVGRKYFTAVRSEWNVGTQYRLSDWCENTEYGADSRLYETEQEWLDEKEAAKLFDAIKEYFGHYKRPDSFTLDELRKVNAIINPEV